MALVFAMASPQCVIQPVLHPSKRAAKRTLVQTLRPIRPQGVGWQQEWSPCADPTNDASFWQVVFDQFPAQPMS